MSDNIIRVQNLIPLVVTCLVEKPESEWVQKVIGEAIFLKYPTENLN